MLRECSKCFNYIAYQTPGWVGEECRIHGNLQFNGSEELDSPKRAEICSDYCFRIEKVENTEKPKETKKVRKQTAVRTYDEQGRKRNLAELNTLLRQGYRVIMCNYIPSDSSSYANANEYILEKEVDETDES